ncbi:hypothetical protein EDD17DRAFT_1781483 [Pisolithus thermaeus]|nr:hypothetical protein EDD17DRAFT_1781483 [Pisolithus thermaeus]
MKKNRDGRFDLPTLLPKACWLTTQCSLRGSGWSCTLAFGIPRRRGRTCTALTVHPSLPSWLSWEGDVFQGTPTPGAESCDIKFVQDGVEERLTQTSLRSRGPVLVPSAPPVTTDDAQVMQRVAQEAQSQVTVAIDNRHHAQTSRSRRLNNVLAAATQQVVLQASRQVVVDRSAAVTVNKVSAATQSAVAQAVEITGPLSNEVDALMTASSLLQQQIRAFVDSPVPLRVDYVPLRMSGSLKPLS